MEFFFFIFFFYMYYENDGVSLPLLQVQIAQGLVHTGKGFLPGIGVYQEKDSGREAECQNNVLEEFKPRLPKQQCKHCSKKCSKQSRQCSNLK